MKIVRAIRRGAIVPRDPSKSTATATPFYNLWDDNKDEQRSDHPMHVPAPKMRLPVTQESYNPPEEYLFTPEEQARWDALDPEDRRPKYIPQKFSSLRSVPAYENFVRERFERCLDLYLCPRVRKTRIHVDPESLIPKLPSPKDLKPFPTTETITYKGHSGRIRCFNMDPTGQWVISGAPHTHLYILDSED
jgi:ribosome biogenesis protein ERB1